MSTFAWFSASDVDIRQPFLPRKVSRVMANVPLLPLLFLLAAGQTMAADSASPATPTTPYDGLKKTVSIEFQASEYLGGVVTADGMNALLTAALVKDGRFIVVERPALAGVQYEQSLGQTGGTAAETAAKTGQLIGSSAIIRGAVTKYEPAASGGGISVSGSPIGWLMGPRAGVKSQTSVMEISLRLIDTTTGQVISTSAAQGSASSTGADAALVNTRSGATLGANAFQNTPIGQAGEQAIIKAVELIAVGMRNVPWSALVVDAADGKVYVNAGAERNVQPGMELNVYRKGKVFTDPATGVVLDVDMNKIGVIRINGVREKLSTATVVSGEAPLRGDLLKLN